MALSITSHMGHTRDAAPNSERRESDLGLPCSVCAMPDSPTDPPEFDWLYGKKQPSGRPPEPPDDEPEHTQVIPRSSVPVPPSSHPAAPSRPAGPATAPRSKRGLGVPKPPRPPIVRILFLFLSFRFLILLLVAWLAFLVAVPTLAWKKIDSVDVTPAGARPAEQPGTTYLLVGSDSRQGLSAAERSRLKTGGDVGQRTDTIMLLHTGDGPPLLMSIPRDSIVPVPGHGTTKINAAFAFGKAKLLIQTIEQNTGLRIDHYIEIGFAGFVKAVDAVGGIEICPNRKMVDPLANLNIKEGCQPADGVVALGYARSRHSDPALGDITRAKHQREVVSAIGDKVKSPWTVLNPFRYLKLNDAATASLRVSEGTGPIDLAKFARAMTQVNGTDGLTCSMPIRDLAVHWDTQRALALLKFIKEDRTQDIPKKLCLPTGLPQ